MTTISRVQLSGLRMKPDPLVVKIEKQRKKDEQEAALTQILHDMGLVDLHAEFDTIGLFWERSKIVVRGTFNSDQTQQYIHAIERLEQETGTKIRRYLIETPFADQVEVRARRY